MFYCTRVAALVKRARTNSSVHLQMIRDRRRQYRTSCVLVTLTGPV